jgi:L-2-hydroxycarboxylate dehydrogenase (NAD+)
VAQEHAQFKGVREPGEIGTVNTPDEMRDMDTVEAVGSGLRIREEALVAFTSAVLRHVGVGDEAAGQTARVLVASDMRGIASHGVARLAYYVTMIEEGFIAPQSEPTCVRESATTAVLDGHNGLGQPVGIRAMTLALDKAAEHDLGMVVVRRSNHYGIAGYYAMMSLDCDMIGISLTNTHPAVVPTHGKRAAFGTNPIAIAVPTAGPHPFVLDMATSVVPHGKLEVAARRGEQLAEGWALDTDGRATIDTSKALLGALLPLGGSELTSGYKGYGLAMAIELLSAVLPGATYGPLVSTMWHPGRPSDLGQFFMAINIAAFDDVASFKARAADLLRRVKDTPLVDGMTEILIAGEKEERAAIRSRQYGVPLEPTVVAALRALATRLAIPTPFGVD